MSSLSRLLRLSVVRSGSLLQNSLNRSISTSNKKDDTTVSVGPTTQEETHCEPKKKFFYDYGFGGKTEKEEYNNMHSAFFMYISVLFCTAGFYYLYRPDINMHDWAKREAYLELRRREGLGLSPIDPNYVDPSTVHLPSDEELGDTEIII